MIDGTTVLCAFAQVPPAFSDTNGTQTPSATVRPTIDRFSEQCVHLHSVSLHDTMFQLGLEAAGRPVDYFHVASVHSRSP